MSTARLECSPETRILLIDGPLSGARTMLLEHAGVGDEFLVPLASFMGLARYVITRVFTTFCTDCELLHKKAVAKHVEGDVTT